jgi:predicted Rossmann fold flavoprotein
MGAKILISGGGRCNVTHKDVTEYNFHTSGPTGVIRRVLQQFTDAETRAFFEELGVTLKLEETGKYFPVTDEARTVLDALLQAGREAGVILERGQKVRRLSQEGNDWVVHVADRKWKARALMMCTGGLSLPRTGSDGSGYALAKGIGHSVIATSPALTPLKGPGGWAADLRGITLPVRLRLSVNGKREADYSGSFLFTHFGYSGPAPLNLSRHWIREGWESDQLSVAASFLPEWNSEKLSGWWRERFTASPKKSVANTVDELLPARLAETLCELSGIPRDLPIGQTPKAERNRLLESILNFDLPVTGALGYEKAEVTAGGVPLTEINANTMGSMLAPGLFFAGEILDVDGWLGGYNFQWAWSSGTVAGRGAAAYAREE